MTFWNYVATTGEKIQACRLISGVDLLASSLLPSPNNYFVMRE